MAPLEVLLLWMVQIEMDFEAVINFYPAHLRVWAVIEAHQNESETRSGQHRGPPIRSPAREERKRRAPKSTATPLSFRSVPNSKRNPSEFAPRFVLVVRSRPIRVIPNIIRIMSTASTARSRKRAHDGSRQKVDVINLETTAPVVNTGSQHEALILRGTRTSPIDVEALDDKRRSRKIMRRSVAVVDPEKDTGPGGYGVAGAIFSRGRNFQGAVHVICLSPDREEGTSKPKNVAQTSTTHAKVAPKEPTFTCPVCLNKLDKPSTTNCGHIFCEKCIQAWLKAQKKCPTCRKSLGIKSFHRVYLPTPADYD
uniref:RING-type domain-containing protein n=1 Tax=Oryza rufipogon TaxID=4529 RepID=A0A0E0QLH1_ORYRU